LLFEGIIDRRRNSGYEGNVLKPVVREVVCHSTSRFGDTRLEWKQGMIRAVKTRKAARDHRDGTIQPGNETSNQPGFCSVLQKLNLTDVPCLVTGAQSGFVTICLNSRAIRQVPSSR